MKKIKQITAAFILVISMIGGLFVLGAAPAYAAACSGNASAKDCITNGVNQIDSGTDGNALGTLIKNVINILLFIVGVAAVIMIVISGIRYVTSGGDQSQVTAAKNTILYAIVGLVVATLAFAIVNFVVDKL